LPSSLSRSFASCYADFFLQIVVRIFPSKLAVTSNGSVISMRLY
jgi:hypothetical protein